MQTQRSTRQPLRLAVLIDADNAQANRIQSILQQIAYYGHITICRAYGDWMQPNMISWHKPMLKYGIRPMQQLSYINNKTMTDFALVIDAMDILHSRRVQGFCIVSSDSDFTPLCQRIREENLFVMGVGEYKTPHPLLQACHVFIYSENLNGQPEFERTVSELYTPNLLEKRKRVIKKHKHEVLIRLLTKAVNRAANGRTWVHLSSIGIQLRKLASNW